MKQISTEPDVRLIAMGPPYQFESPFDGKPFVLLLHSDDPSVQTPEQLAFAAQVVASGCRYVCCSGIDCEGWHDTVDHAYESVDPNCEHLLMTTWHEQEGLEEVAWFALKLTLIDEHVPERFLVVLLRPDEKRITEATTAVRRALQ